MSIVKVVTMINVEFEVSPDFAAALCQGKLTPYEQAKNALARIDDQNVKIAVTTCLKQAAK